MNTREQVLENRKRWTTALRSGDYNQGRSRLVWFSDTEGLEFCCLGVACVVFQEEFGLTLSDNNSFYAKDGAEWRTSLEMIGWEFLGLDEETESELIHLNDGLRVDFNGIADYIDEMKVIDYA